MDSLWPSIARRAVEGLEVQPGDLVQIRYGVDRPEALAEMLLAVERAGGTPLPELLPPDLFNRLIQETPLDHLQNWQRQRVQLMQRYDKILVLADGGLGRDPVPDDRLQVWYRATNSLIQIEEERRLPVLVMAIPSARGAAKMGIGLDEMDALLLPALAAEGLGELSQRVLQAAGQGGELLIRTEDAELRMQLGTRQWMADDGWIDAEDRRRGAVCSNLPAGSIYTTVLEDSTEGSVRLGSALAHFREGRIVRVEPEGCRLQEILARETGEPGRISHIGIGLNPHLAGPPIGWALVDEHIQGALFLALGENRYMGGENSSSLNMDFALQQASLQIHGKTLVQQGKLLV